jgi:hypothetical protein
VHELSLERTSGREGARQYVAVDQEGPAIAAWRRGPDTDERDLLANRFE